MNAVPGTETDKTRSAKRIRTLQRKETIAGFLFIGPMLLGTTVFSLLPIVATFVLSFSDWNFIAGLDGLKWAGWRNFEQLPKDPAFRKSLVNNALFCSRYRRTWAFLCFWLSSPTSMCILRMFSKSSILCRTYPVWLPWPSCGNFLLHPSFGPVNQFLMSLGIDNPPKWIADPKFALLSVMMISVWISIGFNMIVYIAGLQSIPKDLYEAADIDGAGGWIKFSMITFPLFSPTTFFLLITGIIYSFKVFDLIAILTKGGPANSTTVIVWHLYQTAFVNLKIGYASVIALVMFLCVLLLTLVQWIGQKKWVNY